MSFSCVMITGASGAGKSTLAEKLRQALGDRELLSLDATKTWREYTAARKLVADHWRRRHSGHKNTVNAWLDRCRGAFFESYSTAQDRPCIIEGAQLLPLLPQLSLHTHLVVLDVGRDVCVQQHLRRAADEKQLRGEVVSPQWLAERLEKNHQVYDIWEPYLKSARCNGHVCLVQDGDALAQALQWLEGRRAI